MEESKTSQEQEELSPQSEESQRSLGPLGVDPSVSSVHLEKIRFRAWETD